MCNNKPIISLVLLKQNEKMKSVFVYEYYKTGKIYRKQYYRMRYINEY